MKQQSQTCLRASHQNKEIEYVCIYSQCKEFRYLCLICLQDSHHQHNQLYNSHIITKKNYDYYYFQTKQSIRNAKLHLYQFDSIHHGYIGAISNDLKYAALLSQNLQIWDCKTNQIIKSIQIKDEVSFCKFTQDSKILYVGNLEFSLYQLDVIKQFRLNKLHNVNRRNGFLQNIHCISNNLILQLHIDGTITKTHVNLNKQSFKIEANCSDITRLDYNKHLNIIATGTYDNFIKLWNANNGSLITELQTSNSNKLRQILFIINTNQLITVDNCDQIRLWNINLERKQLEFFKLIEGSSIQLILNQQFIIAFGKKLVKIFSIDGKLIRQINHDYIKKSFDIYQIIEPDTVKGILTIKRINKHDDQYSKKTIFKLQLN